MKVVIEQLAPAELRVIRQALMGVPKEGINRDIRKSLIERTANCEALLYRYKNN